MTNRSGEVSQLECCEGRRSVTDSRRARVDVGQVNQKTQVIFAAQECPLNRAQMKLFNALI